MTYINPFQFIEPPLKSLEEFEPSMIKKAKQRLLAEFELSEDGIIAIGGSNVDKRGVLDMLESLENESTRKVHWAVFSTSNLMAFLKCPSLAKLDMVSWKQTLSLPGATAMIGPTLGKVIQGLLQKSIARRSHSEIRIIFANIATVPELLDAEIEKPLLMLVREKLEELESPETVFQQNQADAYLNDLLGNFWQNVINDLPLKHQGLKDDFAIVLLNLAQFVYQQAEFKKWTKAILQRAIQIKSQPLIKQSIRDFGAQLGSRAQKERPKLSVNGKFFLGLLGVILIAIRLSLLYHKSQKPSDPIERIMQEIREENHLSDSRSSERPSTISITKSWAYEELMDTLARYARSNLPPGKEYDSSRPISGREVYKEFWIIGPGEEGTWTIHFRNDGEKDIVLMVENKRGDLESAHYVRSGEHFDLVQKKNIELVFLIYSGANWQESIGTITRLGNGKFSIPGFREKVDHLGRIALDGNETAIFQPPNVYPLPDELDLSFTGALFLEIKENQP